MPITGITGNLGSGKTLIMSVLAYSDWCADGREVFSNYRLSFPFKFLSMRILKELFSKKSMRVADFVIDEMQIFMDSRNSGSERNKLMSYWILQTRKRKVNLLYTTQFYGQVDIRLRNATATRVECVNFGTYENPDLEFTISKRAELNDELYFLPIKRFRLSDPKKFFELYDTNELIDPFAEEGM
jgi:hypothetical protein